MSTSSSTYRRRRTLEIGDNNQSQGVFKQRVSSQRQLPQSDGAGGIPLTRLAFSSAFSARSSSTSFMTHTTRGSLSVLRAASERSPEKQQCTYKADCGQPEGVPTLARLYSNFGTLWRVKSIKVYRIHADNLREAGWVGNWVPNSWQWQRYGGPRSPVP